MCCLCFFLQTPPPHVTLSTFPSVLITTLPSPLDHTISWHSHSPSPPLPSTPPPPPPPSPSPSHLLPYLHVARVITEEESRRVRRSTACQFLCGLLSSSDLQLGLCLGQLPATLWTDQTAYGGESSSLHWAGDPSARTGGLPLLEHRAEDPEGERREGRIVYFYATPKATQHVTNYATNITNHIPQGYHVALLKLLDYTKHRHETT